MVARVYSKDVKLFQKSKSSAAAAVATRPAPARPASRPNPMTAWMVMKKRSNILNAKRNVEVVREKTVYMNERRELSGCSRALEQKQR